VVRCSRLNTDGPRKYTEDEDRFWLSGSGLVSHRNLPVWRKQKSSTSPAFQNATSPSPDFQFINTSLRRPLVSATRLAHLPLPERWITFPNPFTAHTTHHSFFDPTSDWPARVSECLLGGWADTQALGRDSYHHRRRRSCIPSMFCGQLFSPLRV